MSSKEAKEKLISFEIFLNIDLILKMGAADIVRKQYKNKLFSVV